MPGTRDRRLRVLVLATAAGQAAYVAGWIVAGAGEDGYSARDNYVSDLGARTASHPWIMNAAFVLFALSFVAAARVLADWLPRGRASALAAGWFGATGLVFAPVAFLREDCWATTSVRCWEAQQAGSLSWEHYAHLNLSTTFGIFVCLSPVLLWSALPAGVLRRVCGACALLGVAALALGVLLLHPQPPADAHGSGAAQRVEALMITAWVLAVMASALLVRGSRGP